jgi:nucleoside-diphosphate-sugar epimerase
MARVLIVGAGYIGLPLAHALANTHNEVFIIKRRPVELTINHAIHPIYSDLFDLDELPNVDAIIYLVSADGREEAFYQKAYIDGPDKIMRLYRNRMPKRFIFGSSTAVYPFHDGEWVDESTALPAASEMNGIMLQEAEAQVSTFNCDSIITRLGGLYGPGRYHIVDRMKKGEFKMTEKPVYTNRIHQHDCISALRFIYDMPQPESIYNLVDSDPIPVNELVAWISTKLGVPAPTPSQTTKHFYSKTNKRVSNARLLGEGFEFKYPSFIEGYQALFGA